MALLLIAPVCLRLPAGDGEGVGISGNLLERPRFFVPAHIGIPDLDASGLVPSLQGDGVGGISLGVVPLEQPQPGHINLAVPPQGQLGLPAVHRQGGDGAPLRQQRFPHQVEGRQPLALGAAHGDPLRRQQGDRAVHHHLGRQGAGVFPAQHHRAPRQTQDAARFGPQLPDAQKPSAVDGEYGAPAQLHLGQGVFPRRRHPGLGGLRAQQRGVHLLEHHPSRARQPERWGLLPQSPQYHLLASGQRKRAALPVKGRGGQLPARPLHRSQLLRDKGRGGLRPRALLGLGCALRRVQALQQRHQPVSRARQQIQQQPHLSAAPRQQIQQLGHGGGALPCHQQIHQEGLQPRGGAAGKLGPELLHAGEDAARQLFQRLIRGDALGHQLKQLPQPLRRLPQVHRPGGHAPGDNRAQV